MSKKFRNSISLSIFFLVFFTGAYLLAETTETFADEANGDTSFSEGGLTFNATGLFNVDVRSGYGLDDNNYVMNNAAVVGGGVVGSFTNSLNDFHVNSLWIIPIQSNTTNVSINNNVLIRGKLDGSTEFTHTILYSTFNNSPVNRYYTYIDLSSYSSYTLDEVEFEIEPYGTNTTQYLMIDNFSSTAVVSNSAPTDISLSSNSINENVAGNSTVGTLSTTDADVGDSHTYSLVAGTGSTDNGSFNISGSNLRITSSPNYETKTSYSVRIQTDDGNDTYSEAFTISINDLNDVNPVVTASQSFSVNEDVANLARVGTVVATDGDASATTFSAWTETGGTGASIFEINAFSGTITVTDNSSIDYETTTSYTYNVTVSDGTNTSASETVTINILNNLGKPTVTTTGASSITINSASSGGNVTGDGGANISARGVCWNTSANPTTANSSTSDGTYTGSFVSSITGLSAITEYYYRAYAVNSEGTSYGAEYSFTTLPDVAANIFPANSEIDLPRSVTVNWRYDGAGTPDGFKVYQDGVQIGSNILWSGDNLYNKDLDLAAWGATVTWKIVPYNSTGDCSSPTQWSFTVMDEPADPSAVPTEIVYVQETNYNGSNPDLLTLPTINFGEGDVNPTIDFVYSSAVTNFTVFAEVTDLPNHPIPIPANCGAAFRTTLPNSSVSIIAFNFGGASIPDQLLRWNGSAWADITVGSGATFGAGTVTFNWTSVARSDDEEFVVNNGEGPLPITLSSFSASWINSNSQLHWATYTETNNLGWNVYRAESDAFTESSIMNTEIIEGAGTTSEEREYLFIDPWPVAANMQYYYWIESISLAGESEICGPVSLAVPEDYPGQNTPIAPETFGLYQNYPNPFNPNTTINFAVEEAGKCDVTIYDTKGRKIKTLFAGNTETDRVYSLTWNSEDDNGYPVASGVYFYTMKVGNLLEIKKMILLK